MRFDQRHIEELLDAWPRLRRSPGTRPDCWTIIGSLAFSMKPPGLPKLDDTYSIRIEIPRSSSASAPLVFETGGRIVRDIENHVYSNGALCLGSPWMIRKVVGTPPNLVAFVDQCVVPFLYAAAFRERGHGAFPFSELAHGAAGLLEDYQRILGLKGSEAVMLALGALGRRPRVANKRPCPCGCLRRLGMCDFRRMLSRLRLDANREFFRVVARHFESQRKGHPI